MCLILFSYNPQSATPLIVLANRDEFYKRPTAPVSVWDVPAKIIAGTDVEMGGTWMGVTPSGRFAALTNYRDPHNLKADARSRGLIVSEFLAGAETPETYLNQILKTGDEYNGFNLLVGDPAHGLYCGSNQQSGITRLSAGVYGLSNHLLDTPWPKVIKGKSKLLALTDGSTPPSISRGFELLGDTDMPEDKDLPDTGMGLEWERILSPLFILSDIYGTRSSAVLTIERKGKITFTEKTYAVEEGAVVGDSVRIIETECTSQAPYEE